MNEHPSWETLNDYADDALPSRAREAAARHLETCAECRASLAALRAMLSTASAAAVPVEPPPEAWATIRSTVETGKVVAMPGFVRRPNRRPWFRLVAAAVVLAMVSSGTTALIMMRHMNGESARSVAQRIVVSPPESLVLPASVVRTERNYVQTVEELTAALNDSRGKLSPETVRAVQRSLAIIDAAIAEARQALARDPASVVLRDLLAKSYQQKVDVLRRASEHVLQTED